MNFELKPHQVAAFYKIIRNDKSIIIWPRRYGKSYLVYYYIENYIKNNFDKNILFFETGMQHINAHKHNLLSNIDQKLIKKIKEKELIFINGNNIKFNNIYQKKFNLNYELFFMPDLIIYDNNNYNSNLLNIRDISNYIYCNKIRSIFTSDQIDLNLIKILDYRKDYYLNIQLDLQSDINFIKRQFSYKYYDLFDINDTLYQRGKKLQILNKIANES
jgi:hypothetical protein